MRTEMFLQRMVQDVGRRMGPADSAAALGIDHRLHRDAFRHARPGLRWPMWTISCPSFCVSMTSKLEAVAERVCRYPPPGPRFRHRTAFGRAPRGSASAWPTSSILSQSWSSGDTPATMPLMIAVGLGRRRSPENRCAVQSMLQRIQWARLAPITVCCTLPEASPCAAIASWIAVPVERQIVLGGQRLEQLGRDAIGLIQLRRDAVPSTLPGLSRRISSKTRSIRFEPAVDRAEEVRFFLLDHPGHPLGGLGQFRIGAASSPRRRPARA